MIKNNFNIVAFLGTNNIPEKSVTYQIIRLLKENISARVNHNISFEIIAFRDCNIKICTSCNNCFKCGKCPLDTEDDCGKIKQKIEDADCIIFSTPIYLGYISSPMKIIIDRLAYLTHLMAYRGKIYIPIITTSRTGIEKTLEYMTYVGEALGMYPISNIIYIHKDSKEEILHKINKTAYILDKYIKKQKRIESNPDLEILFSALKKDIDKRDKNSYERIYWEENHLIECKTFQDVLRLLNYEKKD